MASTYPDVPIVANQSQGRLLRTLTGLGPRFLVGVPPNTDNWRRERVYEAPINDHLFDRMRASPVVAACGGIPFGAPLLAPVPPPAIEDEGEQDVWINVVATVAINRERWLTMREILPPELLVANPAILPPPLLVTIPELGAHEEERLLDIASLARVAIEEPNRGVAMPDEPPFNGTYVEEMQEESEEEKTDRYYQGPIVPLRMMHDFEHPRITKRATLAGLLSAAGRALVRVGRLLFGGWTAMYNIAFQLPDAWPDVAPGIARYDYYYRLWVWSSSTHIPRSNAILTFARRADGMLQHLRANRFYPTSVRVVYEIMTEGGGVAIPWKLAYDGEFYDLLV